MKRVKKLCAAAVWLVMILVLAFIPSVSARAENVQYKEYHYKSKYNSSVQCVGFAYYVMYKVTGYDAYDETCEQNKNKTGVWTKISGSNVTSLQVGDIVRSNAGHTAIVLTANSNGTYTFVQCWGGSKSKNKIKRGNGFNGSNGPDSIDKIRSKNEGIKHIYHYSQTLTTAQIEAVLDQYGYTDGSYWTTCGDPYSSEKYSSTIPAGSYGPADDGSSNTGESGSGQGTTHVHDWYWASTSFDLNYHWKECRNPDCPITDNTQKEGYGKHDWGEGVIEKYPDEYNEGKEVYHCSICGVTRYVTLPATGGDDTTDESTVWFIPKLTSAEIEREFHPVGPGNDHTLVTLSYETYHSENNTSDIYCRYLVKPASEGTASEDEIKENGTLVKLGNSGTQSEQQGVSSGQRAVDGYIGKNEGKVDISSYAKDQAFNFCFVLIDGDSTSKAYSIYIPSVLKLSYEAVSDTTGIISAEKDPNIVYDQIDDVHSNNLYYLREGNFGEVLEGSLSNSFTIDTDGEESKSYSITHGFATEKMCIDPYMHADHVLGEGTDILPIRTWYLLGYDRVITINGSGESSDTDDSETVPVGKAVTKVETADLKLPGSLKDKYTDVEDLRNVMKNAVIAASGFPKDNTVEYDVTVQISEDKGATWQEASEVDSVTVTLPYPDGTSKDTHDFAVAHMMTSGSDAGEIETPSVTETDEGLQVTLHGLSPVAVSWQETQSSSDEDEDDSSPHTHNMVWDIVQEATEEADGEIQYRCTECGYVEYTQPLSSFAVYNYNIAKQITNAAADGTVTVDARKRGWISYAPSVLIALRDRPDVTLVTDYRYKGKDYEMTIPAGADLSPLGDLSERNSDECFGYLYLGQFFPTEEK